MKTTKLITTGLAVALLASLSTVTLRAAEETDPQLLKEAKVTRMQAEQTALGKVPGGKITAGELEKEHGKLIWSFDIAQPPSKNITEVQVDALTGKIANVQVET
ncbi:MAG: PepSY domain-containing protein, partial [Verrucomicrobiota bacterium]|nr:PepSY domain-containing protein [Verrucomicrobiota bacterium]